MTQGERVREIRKSLKLTLEKFGVKLGVKKSAISDIESGRNTLTEQMAVSICREYNVNYDYLMNGEGEMFDTLPQTILEELCKQYDLDDFDKILLEMYLEMTGSQRDVLKQTIREMIQKIGRWEKEKDGNP